MQLVIFLYPFPYVDILFFNFFFKLMAKDVSKQQAFDADSKAIQQINFTGNLGVNTAMFLIIEEAKETILDFSQGTVR